MITTSSGMSSPLFADQFAEAGFDLRVTGKAQVSRSGAPDVVITRCHCACVPDVFLVITVLEVLA